MRPRPAPSASRIAISRRRAAPRASSRLATLAHAASQHEPDQPHQDVERPGILPSHVVLALGAGVGGQR